MRKLERFRLLSILAIVAMLQWVVFAEDIECFADGECTQSLYVNQWSTADAQECLEICQEYDGCDFFTHYGDGDDLCLGLANCFELDDSGCNQCYSGYKTCADLQCWVFGTCEGFTISVDVFPREEECLEACKNTEGCYWLTYDESDGGCILLNDCYNLGDNDCDTCWSSQVQCGERQEFLPLNLTKVLVIGGKSTPYLDDVEAVDLTSETGNCASETNYPFPVGFPVGTILDGLPTVCGGYNANTDLYTNRCHQYLYEENHWALMDQSMLEARYLHKSSMVDSATWLITGGQGNDYFELNSTEVWRNGEFQPGPSLPFPLRNHCQVTLNASHVALLGGADDRDFYYRHFYLFNWQSGEWTAMPEVPGYLSNDPCGLIKNSANGVELVVLPDHSECHIFNFEDMTWRDGPILPTEVKIVSDQMCVQMEKTFYILGGFLENETVTDLIYMFDNEDYKWILETARLDTARRHGVAIPVPDEMVNCT